MSSRPDNAFLRTVDQQGWFLAEPPGRNQEARRVRTGDAPGHYTRSAGLPTLAEVEDRAMDANTPDGDLTGQHIDLAMMDLLRAHVPLSLLIDLAYPDGPQSHEILAAESA